MEKKMTNVNRDTKKIEQMLFDAKESLPKTNLEWRVSDMAEQKKETKKYPVLRKIAACIAVVLLLGAGGVTILANMELDIDPGEYGQWVVVVGDKNWEACQKDLKIRGAKQLPEAFGEFKFGDYDTTLVAKHGTTQLDALTNNVYNPMCANFYNGVPGESEVISVFIGTLDEAYWSAYFSFDLIEGIWVAERAKTSFEYEGMTVYGVEVDGYEDGLTKMAWKWIDQANGVCFSVFVENDIDGAEVAKAIIDANK